LIYDRHGASIPVLDVGRGSPADGKTVAITLSLSLMKLPALAAKSVDRLTLNISIGMLPVGDRVSGRESRPLTSTGSNSICFSS
jgi:hypothetical protein